MTTNKKCPRCGGALVYAGSWERRIVNRPEEGVTCGTIWKCSVCKKLTGEVVKK